MKRIGIFLLALAMSGSVNAGFHKFTMHSRANCGNNESVSWEARAYRTLGTVTHHYRNGQFIHRFSTGWEDTWRSAAVHWGEAGPGSGWRVIGYHWMMYNGEEKLLDITDVDDCSIYDGWWD